MRNVRFVSLLVLFALLLASCAPAATVGTCGADCGAGRAYPGGSNFARSAGQKGKLLICTDFPYPPQEFFDENGKPAGVDVEIGTEIATRLGLQVQFVNSVFDTIIAAVPAASAIIIFRTEHHG